MSEPTLHEGIEITERGQRYEVESIISDRWYLLEVLGVDTDYIRRPIHQVDLGVRFGSVEVHGELEDNSEQTTEVEQDVLSVETIGNYRRVTFEDRRIFESLDEQDDNEIALEHSKGSKVVIGGEGVVQSVLIKTQAGDIDYAKATAKQIRNEIEKNGE